MASVSSYWGKWCHWRHTNARFRMIRRCVSYFCKGTFWIQLVRHMCIMLPWISLHPILQICLMVSLVRLVFPINIHQLWCPLFCSQLQAVTVGKRVKPSFAGSRRCPEKLQSAAKKCCHSNWGPLKKVTHLGTTWWLRTSQRGDTVGVLRFPN